MKLYETEIGKWLSLIRIQSTPVTVVSLCAGYLTVSETLDSSVGLLILTGALGHWGFYALNDVWDYRTDLQQGKEKKPLVDGSISKGRAEWVSYTLIFLSLILSTLWGNVGATSVYLGASVLGVVYNYYSKIYELSSLYLGMWGVLIVITGALYAGGVNIFSILLGAVLGVHMVWMTVMGDLKDIESDEPNLVHKYGCKVREWYYPNGQAQEKLRLIKPPSFQYKVSFPLVGGSIILCIALVTSQGFSIETLMQLMLVFLVSVKYWFSGWTLGDEIPFSHGGLVKDIVINEIFGVLMILISVAFIIGVFNILLLFLASVVWGMSWLYLLYGSATYFP